MPPTANWRASRSLYRVPPNPDNSTKIAINQPSPRRGNMPCPHAARISRLSKHTSRRSCQLIRATGMRIWITAAMLQSARPTGKLRPPLAGIREASIHHVAVVQVWQTPVQLTRSSIPIPLAEKRPTGSISHIHLLHFLAAPYSQRGSPYLQRATRRASGNTHIVMALEKSSSSDS